MEKKSIYLVLFWAVLLVGCSIDNDDPTPDLEDNETPFVKGTTIVFTPQEEAAKILGTSDEYSKALTRFDIASRTLNASNDKEQDYLDFAAAQAKDWTSDEIAQIKTSILNIKQDIERMGLNLTFPAKIDLIKSSLQEEGGAKSYTRGSHIIVEENAKPDYLIHEIFHILTRHNPGKKDQLYETINFQKSNRIDYPASIHPHVLTNPDAPFLDHTISLNIDGEQTEAVFILYTGEDWEGGSFMNNINKYKKLMLVEGEPGNKTPVLVNNMPVLKEFSAASDLKQKIGNNTTHYNIHPEEILAEHFVMLITEKNVSDPEFIEAMRNVLQQE